MYKVSDLAQKYKEKLITADQAAAMVENGSRIHFGLGCGSVVDIDKFLFLFGIAQIGKLCHMLFESEDLHIRFKFLKHIKYSILAASLKELNHIDAFSSTEIFYSLTYGRTGLSLSVSIDNNYFTFFHNYHSMQYY